MRSDGLRLYTIRPFKIPDESRVNMHMFDIEGAGGVTLQGTLSADRIIASGAIETTEGLKVGVGGILLAGPSGSSHTITSSGTINLDTPDVTITADLSVGEDITASGLVAETITTDSLVSSDTITTSGLAIDVLITSGIQSTGTAIIAGLNLITDMYTNEYGI